MGRTHRTGFWLSASIHLILKRAISPPQYPVSHALSARIYSSLTPHARFSHRMRLLCGRLFWAPGQGLNGQMASLLTTTSQPAVYVDLRDWSHLVTYWIWERSVFRL